MADIRLRGTIDPQTTLRPQQIAVLLTLIRFRNRHRVDSSVVVEQADPSQLHRRNSIATESDVDGFDALCIRVLGKVMS